MDVDTWWKSLRGRTKQSNDVLKLIRNSRLCSHHSWGKALALTLHEWWSCLPLIKPLAQERPKRQTSGKPHKSVTAAFSRVIFILDHPLFQTGIQAGIILKTTKQLPFGTYIWAYWHDSQMKNFWSAGYQDIADPGVPLTSDLVFVVPKS